MHIVTFAIIYQLVMKVRVREQEQSQNEVLHSILEETLAEIRAENKRMERQFDETATSAQPSEALTTHNEKEEIPRGTALNEEMEDFQLPLLSTEVNDTMEASVESKVLQLHKDGITETEIAKKLGIGKTEVELIVKLHEKKG